jgi:WD40 repeat protein
MIKISASIITFCLFTTFVINAQSTPQIIPPQGHGIFPHDFDIHSNSKTIATCGLDRKIVLWDIRTGIPYLSVIGHRAEIRSIRYSWNGEYIITASPDSTVNIWDSETLKLVKSIHTKTQNLYAEFNRTTTQIVVACTNGSAKIYDLEGKLQTEIKAHESVINCAIFSTNGTLIFTGGEDHYLRAFMIDSKKRLLDWNVEAPVQQMFFDAFNTVLVVHSSNGRAELILMPNFNSYGAVPVETTSYFGAIKYVSNIDISPDNNYFAYSDKKGQIFIADAKTKVARGFQSTHDDFISKVKYTWDMKYLVSLGHDNKMTIANLHNFDIDKSQQMPVRIVKQESDYPKDIYFDFNDRFYIRGFHTYDFDLRTGEIENQSVALNQVDVLKRRMQKINTSDKLTFLVDSLRNVVLIENNNTVTDPSYYYIDPTRKYLVATFNGQLYTLDLKNNKQLSQFKYDYEKIKPRKIIISSQSELGFLETGALILAKQQWEEIMGV